MYQRQGKQAFKKDLSNIYDLTSILGNPHLKFKSIHIAGTNGKGSVSHFLASILQEYGLKVGLYTSPHYKDFRERIKINGKLIPKQDIIDFVQRIRESLVSIPASFFEMTVAMAFDYFAKEKVDVAVIETGLGGRLDSTNIITPLLSIITNISFDHVDMLGDTLEAIAGEKAGIIKSGVPVVIGEKNEKTNIVFDQKASEMNAPIFFAEDLYQVNSSDKHAICSTDNNPIDISIENVSPFFTKNIKTVLGATHLLDQIKFINWHKSNIENGISNVKANTYYIGRWEVISERPTVIVDSAHNEAGLSMALAKLQEYQFERLHIVLGFVNDKSIDSILSLFPKNARYYFVKADIPRGLDARELKRMAKEKNLEGKSYVSVKNGLQAAKRQAKKDDLIFVGGSIFVLAEVL